MNQHYVKQDAMHAVLFMMGSVFLLSTMDVAFKQLVEHFSSLQVTFLRCAISAPLFAVWILIQNPRLFVTPNKMVHLLRASFGLLMLWSLGEAFRELPLADAYAIFFAAPLLMALLSGPILKEPAGPLRLGACGVGFLGVLVVLKPGTSGLLSYGSAMALVTVVCYTGTALMLRALGRDDHSLTIAFWFTALVGAASGLLLFGHWTPIVAEHWPWIAVLGVTGTLGQVMITAAFRRASAAVIAPLDYTHMLWAVFYGWLFWGHLPDARTWVGTGIIVGAGLFVIYREHRGRRKQRKIDRHAATTVMEPQVTLPDQPVKNTDK